MNGNSFFSARVGGALLAAAGAVLLAGCATPAALKPGASIADARRLVPGPDAQYALPDGGTRLEFDRYKAAWMLDFDTRGQLVASTQALTPQTFATITPGLGADEVRRRLGRPVETFGTGWTDPAQYWNYRFEGGDCVWFQVGIRNADQKVRDAGIGDDPQCAKGDGKFGGR